MTNGCACVSILEQAALKVKLLHCTCKLSCKVGFQESCFLDLKCKVGGNVHLKLSTGLGPIANKYHEGIVKRTLGRKLKVPEIAEIQANGPDHVQQDCCAFAYVVWVRTCVHIPPCVGTVCLALWVNAVSLPMMCA